MSDIRIDAEKVAKLQRLGITPSIGKARFWCIAGMVALTYAWLSDAILHASFGLIFLTVSALELSMLRRFQRVARWRGFFVVNGGRR